MKNLLKISALAVTVFFASCGDGNKAAVKEVDSVKKDTTLTVDTAKKDTTTVTTTVKKDSVKK